MLSFYNLFEEEKPSFWDKVTGKTLLSPSIKKQISKKSENSNESSDSGNFTRQISKVMKSQQER